MKLVELRDIARKRGIKGYSRLRKADLEKILSGNINTVKSPSPAKPGKIGKKCPTGKVLNRDTNRCISKDGALYKGLLNDGYKEKNGEIFAGTPKSHHSQGKTPPGKVWNPNTKRYISRTGALAKRLGLVTPPKKRTPIAKKAEEKKTLPVEQTKVHSTEKKKEKKKSKIQYDKFVTSPPKTSPVKSFKGDRCLVRSKLPLSRTQYRTVEEFNKQKSMLIVHGTGLGKTLLAVAASQCYLEQYPDREVTILTLATLMENFKKEFKKYSKRVDEKKYHVFTYETFMSHVKKQKDRDCTKNLLIIDEVHSLRNYLGVKFLAAMKCAQKADKILLLTATPVVNTMTDYISLINLLYGRYIIAPQFKGEGPKEHHENPVFKTRPPYRLPYANRSFGQLTKTEFDKQMDVIEELLKGKVSFASKPEGGEFPDMKVHKEYIIMGDNYEKEYRRAVSTTDIFADPEKFFTGYRRAVNAIGGTEYFSGKIKFIIPKLKQKNSNVIFSNWLESGVHVLEDKLKDNKISYSVISGEVSKEERQRIVDRFNSGKFNTLIITTAGSTGIDLKGVRNMFVLDPVWNPATLDQIIGRAVRFRSHMHLPPDERKVDVWILQLKEKNVEPKDSISGDIFLYTIIERKEKMVEENEKMLERISIDFEGTMRSPKPSKSHTPFRVGGKTIDTPIYEKTPKMPTYLTNTETPASSNSPKSLKPKSQSPKPKRKNKTRELKKGKKVWKIRKENENTFVIIYGKPGELKKERKRVKKSIDKIIEVLIKKKLDKGYTEIENKKSNK